MASRLTVRGRKAGHSKAAGSADNALRRTVLARLIAHPMVSTGHICVAAAAGGVTLSGYVTSEVQKDAAITATQRVKGVHQVLDDLTVALPCPAMAHPPAQIVEGKPSHDPTRPSLAFGVWPVTQSGIASPGLQP
jgi:transposase InsO family protein